MAGHTAASTLSVARPSHYAVLNFHRTQYLSSCSREFLFFFFNDTATTEIYTFPTRRSSDVERRADGVRLIAQQERRLSIEHQVHRAIGLECGGGVHQGGELLDSGVHVGAEAAIVLIPRQGEHVVALDLGDQLIHLVYCLADLLFGGTRLGGDAIAGLLEGLGKVGSAFHNGLPGGFIVGRGAPGGEALEEVVESRRNSLRSE